MIKFVGMILSVILLAPGSVLAEEGVSLQRLSAGNRMIVKILHARQSGDNRLTLEAIAEMRATDDWATVFMRMQDGGYLRGAPTLPGLAAAHRAGPGEPGTSEDIFQQDGPEFTVTPAMPPDDGDPAWRPVVPPPSPGTPTF